MDECHKKNRKIKKWSIYNVMEKPFSVVMRNRVVVIGEKKIKKIRNIKNEYYYNVIWMYVIKIIKLKNKKIRNYNVI